MASIAGPLAFEASIVLATISHFGLIYRPRLHPSWDTRLPDRVFVELPGNDDRCRVRYRNAAGTLVMPAAKTVESKMELNDK